MAVVKDSLEESRWKMCGGQIYTLSIDVEKAQADGALYRLWIGSILASDSLG